MLGTCNHTDLKPYAERLYDVVQDFVRYMPVASTSDGWLRLVHTYDEANALLRALGATPRLPPPDLARKVSFEPW